MIQSKRLYLQNKQKTIQLYMLIISPHTAVISTKSVQYPYKRYAIGQKQQLQPTDHVSTSYLL